MKESAEVLIIDYGMGNLWSVLSALKFLGKQAVVSSEPNAIIHAKKLILPGVGSFRRAMEAIRSQGIEEAILEAVTERKTTLLGICLGMQLLATFGTEDGETKGLGLVEGRVDRFDQQELSGLGEGSRLFCNLPSPSDFYFVHSYRMLPSDDHSVISTCNHGVDYVAAIEKANVFGVQFHPEKSQTNGLVLLRNFLEL